MKVVEFKKKYEKFDINNVLQKTYNRLTITGQSEYYIKPKSGQKEVKVFASCQCNGNIKSYIFADLRSGKIKSCGCIRLEKPNNLKHGQAVKNCHTVEYRTWAGIKKRCINPNDPAYKNYGGRGIKVCKEWINDFPKFLSDMGERPSPQHSIERDDVNGDYCKGNCYWATRHQQAANRRNSNKTIGVSNTKNGNKWCATLKIKNKCVLNSYFDTEQEAIDARKQAEIENNIYNN